MGLALNEGTVSLEKTAPSAEAQAEDLYSHPHPLVVDKLDAMGDTLTELEAKRGAASKAQDDLEASQHEALRDQNSGTVLQRVMLGAKADFAVQQKALKRLQEQETHLTQEHDGVTLKLKAIMDPRIAKVKSLVGKRRQAVTRTEEGVQKWDAKTTRYKQSALQTLARRKATLQSVQETKVAIEEAREREQRAERQYEDARQKVSAAVEQYKLSQTKSEAERSKVADRKEDQKLAEVSLLKAEQIYKVEQERIDKALKYSQLIFHKRIDKVQQRKEKARRRFKVAQEHLATWQTKQKQLVEEADHLRKEYEGKTQEFEQRRAKVLSSATDKAGEQATAQSDDEWSDWAWSKEGDVGVEDQEDLEEGGSDP